jgi:monofunctional biosynthetic peptidoglycan transglycosylase
VNRLVQPALLSLLASAFYVLNLPDVAALKRSNPRTTAYIELRKEQARAKKQRLVVRQEWVPWDRISDHLKDAVLVAEDDMFYKHSGVDWDAVQIAFQRDWEKKRLAFGASTITQQVARNLYLSPSKNPLRKIKELLIARQLEKELGKRRIFELYLNIAEWGRGIYGCEAAAQAYFGKPASELTAEEAAAMAVVLPNPRRWDPAKRGRYVERNMKRVLGRMRASGLLDEADDAQAVLTPDDEKGSMPQEDAKEAAR